MKTRDITAFMEENETSKTRAFNHALDIEFLILEEMDRKGISKKGLAERMGISLQNLSKLLNTQPNMTLETIARFELALDFDLDMKIRKDEQLGVAFHASYASFLEPLSPPLITEDETKKAAIIPFPESGYAARAARGKRRNDYGVAA